MNGAPNLVSSGELVEQSNEGSWLPLMEYAQKTGSSLSTLRRHIKAQKVRFKLEGGRYFLWDAISSKSSLESETHQLRLELAKCKEEIADLKTLIALYEEKTPQKTSNS